LADFAREHKRLYAVSSRCYSDAFDADPTLAAGPEGFNRYNAACAAALAGCGAGEGVAWLDRKERAHFRKQALDWLRADAEARGKRLKSERPGESAAARRALTHWQSDRDLAGVRDKNALEKLPEDERKDWQKLWAEVEALLKDAAPPKKE
jgi:serine/threonine-protein kinase